MPYIDEKYIYDAINEWRGNNDMYGMTHNAEEELIREIDQLPRVDGRHVMTCDTCRANKVCDHRKYGFENCGNYIPLDVGGRNNALCESCRHFRENKCNTFCDSGESYSPDMSKIPTADVVEVARCKDCVHWSPLASYGMNSHRTDGYCNMLSQIHYAERDKTEQDHFCSYGERKDK